MRIPLSRPSLTQKELTAVGQVFDSGWLGEGAWTASFEHAVAEYVGAPHVVAVNTGTSALHLALEALGVGPGDEVIVPTFTFVSDPVAVRMCGATPVFADISPETLSLDPEDTARRITERTRVIMPTDYAGRPADVPSLRRIIGNREIRIVRDAAHSFGSLINGRPVGLSQGEDATCFSFDPIKNLTCGEGGAVAVAHGSLARELRERRNLGFRPGVRARSAGSAVAMRGVVSDGFRYHMSNINAAIGLAQFGRLDDLLNGRRQVARWYDELLRGCSEVRRFSRDYTQIVPFIYPVLVDPTVRDELIARFGQEGIHADLRYSLCHQEPLFGPGQPSLPHAEAVADSLLCLPIYTGLQYEQVCDVVSLLVHLLSSLRVVAGAQT